MQTSHYNNKNNTILHKKEKWRKNSMCKLNSIGRLSKGLLIKTPKNT
jgi:hypothetical protein